jgi:hypothetical protein
MEKKRLYSPPFARELTGMVASGGKIRPLADCTNGLVVKSTVSCHTGDQPAAGPNDCGAGSLPGPRGGCSVGHGALTDYCKSGGTYTP